MVNKRREKLRQMQNVLSRASFTVETACVMPLILLTLTGVLYLCLYVHNRTWLGAAACEAALSGSMEGIKENGKVQETAEAKARELGNQGFFGGANLRMTAQGEKDIKVTYDMETEAAFGISWKLHAEGSSEIVRPTEWVRRVKGASELLRGGDGSE